MFRRLMSWFLYIRPELPADPPPAEPAGGPVTRPRPSSYFRQHWQGL